MVIVKSQRENSFNFVQPSLTELTLGFSSPGTWALGRLSRPSARRTGLLSIAP